MNLSKRFDNQFAEVVKMIHQSRYNAIKNVNTEIVKLYWNIGEYISKKLEAAEWGDAVVDQLADYIQVKHPEFKGFTRRGLYRMRQFYDTYRQKEFVSAVLTQIHTDITSAFMLSAAIFLQHLLLNIRQNLFQKKCFRKNCMNCFS